MKKIFLALVFSLFFTNLYAQENNVFTPQDALNSLQGEWQGALKYKDYQNGDIVTLPMKRNIKILEDKSTIFETDIYDDGPQKIVYIYGIIAFNNKNNTIQTSNYRKNRNFSNDYLSIVSLKEINEKTPLGKNNWVLIMQTEAKDNDKPAILRYIWQMEDGKFTSKKEVQFLNDETKNIITRNSIELIKTPK